MCSFKLKRLELPKNIVNILEKQNIISCKDALSLTTLELQYLLGISKEDVLKIVSIISQKCISEVQTVLTMYQNMKESHQQTFFPTSLYDLDLLLHGGLLLGNVTEFSGPPGVGKTQFCLMLSVLSTLPVRKGGLNGQVIYIDTESSFSAVRLKQIAQNKFPEMFQSETDITLLLQSISVYSANSILGLKEILTNIELDIIKKNVKLVIIDSIASLVRKEYGAPVLEAVMERNDILLEQASILKDIAQTYRLVVFLTNQITSHSVENYSVVLENCPKEDLCEEDQDYTLAQRLSEFSSVKRVKLNDRNTDQIIPALGMSWSHCVNTRLMAQFVNSDVRQLIVAKSPIAPNSAVNYVLNKTGLALTGQDVEYLKAFRPEHQNILSKYNFLS